MTDRTVRDEKAKGILATRSTRIRVLLISSARQRAAEGGLSVLGEELLGGGPFGGRQRALQGESVGLQRRGGVGPTSALQEVVFLILSGLHYFSAVFLHYILHRF